MMTDWIEIGLLVGILVVQLMRWLLSSGLWAEMKQRRRLRRRRK